MKVGSKQWTQLITGSKIAAICGMSKFSSPIDIFCLMTGRDVPSEDGDDYSKPIKWGKRKERAIVDSFCEDYDIRFINKQRNITFIHPDKPFAATPDYWDIIQPKEPKFEIAGFESNSLYIEAKSLDAFRRYLYGEEMSDEIDKEYYFQVQFGMGVVNAWAKKTHLKLKLELDRVFVRVLFGAFEDVDFVVERNDKFIKKLFAIGEDFLGNYVNKDIPPPVDASNSYKKFMIGEFDFPNKVEKPMVEFEELRERLDTKEQEKLLDAFFNYNEVVDQVEDYLKMLRLYKNLIANAIGENYGLQTGIGKFLNYPVSGRVSNTKILEAVIKKYKIPEDVIKRLGENNRSEPSRTFRYFPSKDVKQKKELDKINK